MATISNDTPKEAKRKCEWQKSFKVTDVKVRPVSLGVYLSNEGIIPLSLPM